jgi:hypothetical protein
MNPARQLTYRFYNLPYHVRLEVAQKLHLVEDGDEGLEKNERYRRYAIRAREKCLLEKLWEEVENRYDDEMTNDVNPFVGH